MKEDLLMMKTQINEAKTKVSELKGKQEYLLAELKKDFSCKTIDEAEKKVKTLKLKKEELDSKLEIAINKLKEQYDFS